MAEQPHALYDCGGKGHGPNVSEIRWCHDCTPPRTDLRVLLDAIETMDQKITPYGERDDGTILHYIVADSTWHRVLAAARNPRWEGLEYVRLSPASGVGGTDG